MTKARKLIKVSLATIFVYIMTLAGFNVNEPVVGLIALGIVILYFKADFSK